MPDVSIQSVVPADSGIPPLICNSPAPAARDPVPGDTYSGSGPRGLPLDGDGWRYHISHQRYSGPAIDHNALNELERYATNWRRPGRSCLSCGRLSSVPTHPVSYAGDQPDIQLIC